jgi:hypothetical protein
VESGNNILWASGEGHEVVSAFLPSFLLSHIIRWHRMNQILFKDYSLTGEEQDLNLLLIRPSLFINTLPKNQNDSNYLIGLLQYDPSDNIALLEGFIVA